MIGRVAQVYLPCLAKAARHGAPHFVNLKNSNAAFYHPVGGRIVITKISVSLIFTGPASPRKYQR
jgi:hypothetical protein